MRRLTALISLALSFAPAVSGQVDPQTLLPGKTIERTLSTGQTHSYTIALEKDQFLQLAVEQRGVDVIIRVFMPDGKLLRQFDSPTGREGTEYAELVTETAGTFRVEVAPLDADENSSSGKYELKVVDLRKATEAELQFRKNENTRKAKARSLLVETSQNLDQLRLPESRVRMRIRAAQLLWPSEEKKASALLAQAIEIVKQLIADNGENDADYGNYQLIMQLRGQVIDVLAPRDPEAALEFLQSTRISGDGTYRSADPEVQLESSLMNQVVTADPKRAFDLAEDMLKHTSSPVLIQTLTLASKDQELACGLAHDIAKKLQTQDLIKSADSVALGTSLLQAVRGSALKKDGESRRRLLSDEEFRDLLLKMISDLLSYAPSEQGIYTPEYLVVRNLAVSIGQFDKEIKTWVPERSEVIHKKLMELTGSPYQPGGDWQRYQAAVSKEPVETALESVAQAPPQMRDYLYQQVVTRIAATGDLLAARQIISDRISNPAQRRQMLHSLQVQGVTLAAEKGKIDEALRLLTKFQPSERSNLINQILDHIGPEVKNAEAVQYLEQAKSLITTSVRAEDSLQMHTLLAIARAMARRDFYRSFQIVEPLIDQFNEICAAAVTMNGFSDQYYVDGEMVTSERNPIAETASEISGTLATLAMYDFDRAKRDADGITRLDARLRTFLRIAQRTLEIKLDSDEMEDEPLDYR